MGMRCRGRGDVADTTLCVKFSGCHDPSTAQRPPSEAGAFSQKRTQISRVVQAAGDYEAVMKAGDGDEHRNNVG
jgi:hypothetical protein